jgi:outer membrane protein assembly factor BamB
MVLAGSIEARYTKEQEGELRAVAVVVEKPGGSKVAIVACDVLWIPRDLADAAVAEIEKKAGIRPDHILINATHTHHAPSTAPAHGFGVSQEFREILQRGIVQAVEQANRQLEGGDAQFFFQLGEENTIGGNSRLQLDDGNITWLNPLREAGDNVKPTGPFDPQLPVLDFRDTAGKSRAVIYNHSTHTIGTRAGRDVRSPSFYGLAAQELEVELGGVVSFLEGASGSTHNISLVPVAEAVERLKKAVLTAREQAKPSPINQLAGVRRPLKFRVRHFDEGEEDAKILRYTSKYAPAGSDRIREVFANMRRLLKDRQGEERETWVQAMVLGDVAIVGVPAEYFTALGVDIKKRSPFKNTLVAELANDWIGYLPDREGHRLGGYQTWMGLHSYAEPGTGERVADAAVEILQELFKNSQSAQSTRSTKYPLDDQLRILAEDIESANYRALITEKMLATDLAAEWQRVATADNPESFLAKHGGKDKVLADLDLRQAYEERVQIRNRFLDLMREGYKRYKQTPPFDKGETAELAGTMTKAAAGKAIYLAPVPPAPGSENNWPRFRGPTGQGLTRASSLPTEWDSSGTNIVWQTPVPGEGNSSPIIWDNRIFVTSSTADGTERFVHCFDRRDGRQLWTQSAPKQPPETGVRDKNGYASATPVTDGQRVVAFFGTCGLVCLDLDGNRLWSYNNFKVSTGHGPGSSPIIYNDLVILAQDQNQADSIFIALDKQSGELRWQSSRPRAMTWSSPIIVKVGDHDELIVSGGKSVKGYEPTTGRELWSLTGPTEEVIPTVAVGPTMLFSASGRNGPTIALRPGGSGDVTETHLAWRTVRGGPHVPSLILVRDRIFVVNDTGIASCMDAATGKMVWQQRIRDTFSASPVEAGGLVYFPSESGVTYILRAADKFEIVATNDLMSPILASPAVCDSQLFLRTKSDLFCIGEKAAGLD